MKVLHVIPSIASIRGGPSHAVIAMVKALKAQNIEVEIVTTNDNGKQYLDVPLGERTIYQNVPVWFLPRCALPIKEFIFSASLTKWLWQHIGDYDLVHNHYLFSYASSCAGLLARFKRIPYIVRTIGQLTPWSLAQSSFKKEIYSALIERHNLNHARAIHCTASGEAEDVRRFGITTPTLTIPLGVESPKIIPEARSQLRQQYNLAPEIPIILFLSRLHYKKRPDLLLSSVSEIAASQPEAHLIMAGSGDADYVSYLQQLVKQLNLSDRVTFPGFVTGQAKQILLQGADLFVLPSYSENFGIAVAEAMVVGLPVVITPGVQIAPDIEAANAGIVIQEDAELATAMNTLLNSADKRTQLGNNALNLAIQKYSWDAIATELIAAYQEIIHAQSAVKQ